MSQSDFIGWLDGYIEATLKHGDFHDEDLCEFVLRKISEKINEVKNAEKTRVDSAGKVRFGWGQPGIMNAAAPAGQVPTTTTTDRFFYGEKAAEDIFPPRTVTTGRQM